MEDPVTPCSISSPPCEIVVRVDGIPLPLALRESLLQMTVEESLCIPSRFTLVLNGNSLPAPGSTQTEDPETDLSLGHWFAVGRQIEIAVCPETIGEISVNPPEQSLCQGQIRMMEIQLTSAPSTICVVQGYDDAAYSLHQGRQDPSLAQVTDTEAIRQPAHEAEIPLGALEDRGQATTLTLRWPIDFHSFRLRVGPAGQINSADVEGRGHPEIRVGERIRLHNINNSMGHPSVISNTYDGEYCITACRHLYHECFYTTEFSVQSLDRTNLPKHPQTSMEVGLPSLRQELDGPGKRRDDRFQTIGDHKIRVNDDGKRIELETAGGLKISLDDENRNITLCSNGSLDIKAEGNIRIKGTKVYIN